MKYKRFFIELCKFVDSEKKIDYTAKPGSFKYEIREQGMNGKFLYDSQWFYNWQAPGMKKIIINDIKQQFKRL